MSVKNKCLVCNGNGGASGCDFCDDNGYVLAFKRDPEVSCQECGEHFRDGSEEAEFIGWHGVCAQCELNGGGE